MTSFLNTLLRAMIYSSNKPVSGYDLAKMLKTGNSHQQVYRELAKIALRDDIMVTSVKQDDKPDKKLYFTTPSRRALGFSFSESLTSDFSKTPRAYELSISDVLNDNNIYEHYVGFMSIAEMYFNIIALNGHDDSKIQSTMLSLFSSARMELVASCDDMSVFDANIIANSLARINDEVISKMGKQK